MTTDKTEKGTGREEGGLILKSADGKLLGDQPSGLQCLALKGLTLLSALLTLLRKRPRGVRLRRPDTTSSRDKFQVPTRSEMSGGTFAGAQTFRDLFQRLDAKGVLWGSQKRYTAKELKALINRVRTTNPQFHLPLEVIPATGGLRERVKALAVDYDQATHPGVLRVPTGKGELWKTLNNSQNALFHDLPSDWVSIRLKIAAFNPTADFQQVGLMAYQDDDTYVSVRRNYNSKIGGPNIGAMYGVKGITKVVERQPFTNTGDLILRLDRDLTTNAYSTFYSVDGGTTWTSMARVPTVVLKNPRVGIQVEANIAGTLPGVDLEWVEILRSAS